MCISAGLITSPEESAPGSRKVIDDDPANPRTVPGRSWSFRTPDAGWIPFAIPIELRLP